MGGLCRAVGGKKKRGGPAPGQWEWDFERSTATGTLNAAELAELVALSVIGKPNVGHLCSDKDLVQLRRILTVDEHLWPNDVLHRHLDELAVIVGLRLKDQRKTPLSKRRKDIRTKLLDPARKLVNALADTELSKELRQPGGGFSRFNHKGFSAALEVFIIKCERHEEKIREFGQKGKAWDSDLKVRFAELVSMLCEYINHDFEPKRRNQGHGEENSAFRDAVRLLGLPIFGDDNFDGAIRKVVDRWNSNKKEMIKKIIKRKAVAEKASE